MVYAQRLGTKNPSPGIYIQDTEGYYHVADEWNGVYMPNGIAVITEIYSFIIALTDVHNTKYKWGGYGKKINSMSYVTSTSSAQTDVNGSYYTSKIIETLKGVNDGYVDGAPAAEACRAFIFPNGSVGHLGSGGEWYNVLINKSAIDYALNKCGGTPLSNNDYWTSQQYSSERSWYATVLYTSLGNRDRNIEYNVRAFTLI